MLLKKTATNVSAKVFHLQILAQSEFTLSNFKSGWVLTKYLKLLQGTFLVKVL